MAQLQISVHGVVPPAEGSGAHTQLHSYFQIIPQAVLELILTL